MSEVTGPEGGFDRQKVRIERPKMPRDLDALVDGRNYQFKYEPRCKVCKSGHEISSVVNKLLVQGLTYQAVFDFVESSYNKVVDKKDRISYSSIRTHQKLHLPFESAAIREIIERRAASAQKDFIEGTESLITPATYAEVMMNQAFRTMTQPGVMINPSDGLAAARDLHKFIQDEEGSVDAAIALQQLNRIIMAVRAVCTDEQMEKIVGIIEGRQEALTAEIVEDFDPGVDEFDPDDDDGDEDEL